MYPGIATVNGVLVAKTISADKVMPLNAAAVRNFTNAIMREKKL